jgi:hypothetical protein
MLQRLGPRVAVMDSNIAIAIGTGLAAIAATTAVVVSIIVYKGQSKLSRDLSREQSATSEKISKEQAALSLKIHENQTLLSQRQLLIPLWNHMSVLNHIDPNSPVEPDVLKSVNTLELVAVSCEGGMVDTQVIKRTFRDLFMRSYEEIQAIKMLPGRKVSGATLLHENRAAMKFYKELQDEHLNRDSLN